MQAGGWLGALMRLRRFALIALTFCTLFGNATPAFTAPGEDAPMRFAVVRGDPGGCDPICPEWISAEGKIVGDTAAKFRKFLKKLGDRQLPLVIHSPGGDVQNALAMGRLIREKKLDVAVGRTAFSSCSPETKGCKGGYTGWALPIGALCNSACPLVLAGGTQRLVGKAALGVHQITTTTVREKIQYKTETRFVRGKKVVTKRVVRRERSGTSTTTRMSKALRRQLTRYLEEMGISTGLMGPIETTPAARIRLLTRQELIGYKLTTAPWDVSALVEPTLCARSPRPAHCSQVASPPRLAIVRSGAKNCLPHCDEWISLEGDIDDTVLPLLRDALQKTGSPRPIVLSSRGGDIESALQLGRFVRAQGLPVAIGRTVSSKCRTGVSACEATASYDFQVGRIDTATPRPLCTGVCLLALAGGVERIVGNAPVRLDSLASLQRYPAGGKKKKKDQSDTVALLASYLNEMGVDTALLERMPAKPSESVGLAPWRMKNLKLATK